MEVVVVGCGDEEGLKGEVFGIRTCLPLPLSLVEASLVGIDACVDVSCCSNSHRAALPLYTILACLLCQSI